MDRLGQEVGVEVAAWHLLGQPVVRRVDRGMGSTPVRSDEPGEPYLLVEALVEDLRVLAGRDVVDVAVGAFFGTRSVACKLKFHFIEAEGVF